MGVTHWKVRREKIEADTSGMMGAEGREEGGGGGGGEGLDMNGTRAYLVGGKASILERCGDGERRTMILYRIVIQSVS
jgi:hypothetical protein